VELALATQHLGTPPSLTNQQFGTTHLQLILSDFCFADSNHVQKQSIKFQKTDKSLIRTRPTTCPIPMGSQPPGGSILPLLEGVNFCHSCIACEETHSMLVVNIDCIMISLLRALPKPPALSLTLIQQNSKFSSHLVISSSSQLLKTATLQLSHCGL
jgi:hypothetical protein